MKKSFIDGRHADHLGTSLNPNDHVNGGSKLFELNLD